jgi:hypothetical protein
MTPSDKLLYLVLRIGNQGLWYNTTTISKLLDCNMRTANRYINRVIDASLIIPNLEVIRRFGNTWEQSEIKINYK